MPPTPEPTATELLIDRAFARRAQIAALEIEQAQDEAAILVLGKGRHSGANPANRVTVVAATPAGTGAISYGLPADGEAKARELAGEEWKALFDRQVIYSPCEAFDVVAGKILTPAKARDLVALCLVPGKASNGKKSYILWPK